MDMNSSSDSSDDSTMMMMVPYLHFTGGDALFFKSITPSSNGAIAGAAIFLFFFAIAERYVVAMRAVLEVKWRQRVKDRLAALEVLSTDDDSNDLKVDHTTRPSMLKSRLVVPFIVSHDVMRGLMYTIQSFFHFALMLAVMTFQAAYIITIIAGLGVGEIIFGRLSSGDLTIHKH